MSYCNKLIIQNIINENDFYNSYIIETECQCKKCKFLEKKIRILTNDVILPLNIRDDIGSYQTYYLNNYLNNIKNVLIKNDLYAKKIFSIV